MNGYHRNPNNQRFTRFTVYDQGHLVFTTLDSDEAYQDFQIRTEMRSQYCIRMFGTDPLDMGFILKEELCDLKGYVIGSRSISGSRLTDRSVPEVHVDDLRRSRIAPAVYSGRVEPGYSSIVREQQSGLGMCYRYRNPIDGRSCCVQKQHLPQTFDYARPSSYHPKDDVDDLSTPSVFEGSQTQSQSQARHVRQPARQNVRQNVRQTVKKDEPNLEAEMAKLAANLSKIVSQENAVDVEDVYPDLRDEIQMDKEIEEMENEFVDDSSTESDEDSDNYYDQMMKIRTRQPDSDSDSDEFGDRKRRHERGEFSDDEQDPNDIPKNLPAHLKAQFKQLLDARNAIADKVRDQEELVKKANLNLNNEQFKERCRRQDEKRAKKKKEEDLSVLSANKITYLKMRSKISKGVMKEENVPFMFNDKYCVLRYMEVNELIDLGSNDEIEDELEVYNALNKAIEAREYETRSHGSDSDSDYTPLEEVDDSLLDICFDFMEFLEQNFPNTISEAAIHVELNKDMQVNDEIFRRDINNANVSRHDVEEGELDDGSEDGENYSKRY
jgi:hypothetical protein